MNISTSSTAQERQNEAVSAWIEGTMAKYDREFLNKEQAEAETRLDYTAVEPRLCLCAGCFEPMTMLDESGDCKRHAIEGWLEELSRESDSNARMEIVIQLMKLGWVAE